MTTSRPGLRTPALFLLLVCGALAAGAPMATAAGAADGGSQAPLGDADLDRLVAPIALYPDALVAQILPASTYPVEIVEAARALAGGGTPDAKTVQQWDPSIQALVSVPSVLKMMNDRLDWTTQLGQAVSQNQGAVMGAVQRVREDAQKAGNLQSNAQQVVQNQGDTIVITPANPQWIYVPQYDPVAILAPPPPMASYGLMTFGLGFAAGALTAYSCDWGDHWGGSTIVVNDHYDWVNARTTTIDSVNRNDYSSWRAPANVGRVTAGGGVPTYTLTGGGAGDDDRGAAEGDVDRAAGRDWSGDGGVDRDDAGVDRGGDDLARAESIPQEMRAGDSDLGGRSGGGGGVFSGAGGDGWNARAASDRGAQSLGGGFGGGGFGRGGGGFRR